jgi:hypothetical protein
LRDSEVVADSAAVRNRRWARWVEPVGVPLIPAAGAGTMGLITLTAITRHLPKSLSAPWKARPSNEQNFFFIHMNSDIKKSIFRSAQEIQRKNGRRVRGR